MGMAPGQNQNTSRLLLLLSLVTCFCLLWPDVASSALLTHNERLTVFLVSFLAKHFWVQIITDEVIDFRKNFFFLKKKPSSQGPFQGRRFVEQETVDSS